MGYVAAFIGVVGFAQGIAFLGRPTTRLAGVVLAPAGVLALAVGLVIVLSG